MKWYYNAVSQTLLIIEEFEAKFLQRNGEVDDLFDGGYIIVDNDLSTKIQDGVCEIYQPEELEDEVRIMKSGRFSGVFHEFDPQFDPHGIFSEMQERLNRSLQ